MLACSAAAAEADVTDARVDSPRYQAGHDDGDGGEDAGQGTMHPGEHQDDDGCR
jgi:hypothetical protein